MGPWWPSFVIATVGVKLAPSTDERVITNAFASEDESGPPEDEAPKSRHETCSTPWRSIATHSRSLLFLFATSTGLLHESPRSFESCTGTPLPKPAQYSVPFASATMAPSPPPTRPGSFEASGPHAGSPRGHA